MFTDERGNPNFSNIPTDQRFVLTMKTDPAERKTQNMERNGIVGDAQNKQTLRPEIRRAAAAYHLDPALLQAVIATESGYEVNAISGKGAMGLMQLMPETARRYGASDPFDPAQNIRAGAEHLSSLLQRFGNNLPLALAAYNSGETNVVKYGERIPPFRETAAYVPRVIRLYRKYQRETW
jgi:soluble lytic murein transglycosylase-like protein